VTRAVLALPITDIAIGERLGFYHEPHAMQLGARIAIEGQSDPIHVRCNGNAAKVPWTLVAGLHRLRGVGLVGLDTIDAIQVADASVSPDALRRLELSENLDHRERRPIERAILMVERARLEEAVDHPGRVGEASQVRAGRARQSASITMMDAEGWKKRSALAAGCSIPTLERHLRLHRTIVEALPDLAQALNFHPLGASLTAMTRLAQVRDQGRRVVAEAILADAAVSSVDEACARVAGASRKGNRSGGSDDAKFLASWDRLSPKTRRPLAIHIADTVSVSIAAEMIASFTKRGLI